MIALGGVIGAGLFVGSGTVIHTAGVLAPLAYAVGGVILLLVMRMLAEMAAARPSVGSFSDHARLALGNGAGFIIGWTYWYFWVVVVAFEAVAGAEIIGGFLPHIPLWIISAAVMGVMSVINLLSVRGFGETEFWFAAIKVVAIVVFLGIAIAGLFGVLPGQQAHDLAIGDGSLTPAGAAGVLSAVTVVVFSYFGAEIVTIAAAEATDPVRAVTRAASTVVWRVIIFYVGSIGLIVLLVPHTAIRADASPFVTLLERLGIPGAALAMQIVVLTAVLSVLNAGIYTASRMLFALTARGEAPSSLARTTTRGTPIRAIVLSTVAGWLAVAVAYLAPEAVFAFLLNAAGSVALVIYAAIAISQLRLRRLIEQEGGALPVRMWGHPYLSWFTLGLLAAVAVGMLILPDSRAQLGLGLIAPAGIAVVYLVRRLFRLRIASPVTSVLTTEEPQ
ncbi:amino acid permease [Nonomuraea sp. NEAU-A123]|uniref:amino acid permease n=1 Tax=Nonomuraea sp. NEAU-A123 TaxID=2839649 RepID=UPI001BE48351|nr:amino acid permease [Nonomuraea sp. NEAU-A123]MBT2227967.1 amino acid permease [Nonomuraea sp. NEAU-A123]